MSGYSIWIPHELEISFEKHKHRMNVSKLCCDAIGKELKKWEKYDTMSKEQLIDVIQGEK